MDEESTSLPILVADFIKDRKWRGEQPTSLVELRGGLAPVAESTITLSKFICFSEKKDIWCGNRIISSRNVHQSTKPFSSVTHNKDVWLKEKEAYTWRKERFRIKDGFRTDSICLLVDDSTEDYFKWKKQLKTIIFGGMRELYLEKITEDFSIKKKRGNKKKVPYRCWLKLNERREVWEEKAIDTTERKNHWCCCCCCPND